MSDTPRCDAAGYAGEDSEKIQWVKYRFAQKLERELTEANRKITEYSVMVTAEHHHETVSELEERMRNLVAINKELEKDNEVLRQGCLSDPLLEVTFRHLNGKISVAKTALERLANMPEYDQDDAHRLRKLAKLALKAINQTESNAEPQ